MRSFKRSALALVVVLGVGCDGLETGETEQPQILWNQILWNQILWNALTGTPESMEELISHRLATRSFDPTLGGSETLALMLEDENAQVFMHYLVSCALAPAQSVRWQDHTWYGAAGLCTAWADAPPSVACQEMVSACLIARNNKKGHSVQFSPRGRRLDGTAMPTSDQVPVKWTDIEGEPIASLRPCDKNSSSSDCGWNREASVLGQCEPTGPAVDLDCGDLINAKVRVCSGVEGCDQNAAFDEALCAVETFGGLAITTAIHFPCPPSGVFGVMQKAAGKSYNAAIPEGPNFPSTELELYWLREGAFWGNLLDPALRNPDFTRTVDPTTGRIVEKLLDRSGVVYEDAWACNAPTWKDEDALMKDRLCAVIETEDPTDTDSAELCVATALGPCHTKTGATDRCATIDALPVDGDGDYDRCVDGNGVLRSRQITTYLDGPCAMASNVDVCILGP